MKRTIPVIGELISEEVFPPDDDAKIARHGWAALLALLQHKGVISEQEAQAVIMKAHRQGG